MKAVEETHAQDALERLLLGQVGEPEHHPGVALRQARDDAVEEAGEEDVLEEQCPGGTWMTTPTTPERPEASVRAARFGR